LNTLSGFAEYDYYNFGTRTNAFVVVGGGTNFADIKETKFPKLKNLIRR
jgi:hypothetical protein